MVTRPVQCFPNSLVSRLVEPITWFPLHLCVHRVLSVIGIIFIIIVMGTVDGVILTTSLQCIRGAPPLHVADFIRAAWPDTPSDEKQLQVSTHARIHFARPAI